MTGRAETEVNGPTAQNTEGTSDICTTDFATLVTTNTFVDKTLMIQEIFSSSSRILITAPQQFGKSTNIEMVKRFLEIEVDMNGTAKPVHTTKNYKLFKGLQISKDEEFFNQHFGKHPVIHIDCRPLGGGPHDIENMLDAFVTTIKKSFYQHSYLFYTNREYCCWFEDFYINNFKNLVCDLLIRHVQMKAEDLFCSFKYLSAILCRHFEKKVFVLVDNYDVFVHSLILKNDPDMNKIISFIGKTFSKLLNDDLSVECVLLTGELPVTCNEFPFYINSIECYYFLDGHPFCKYYGLTSEGLDLILGKFIDSNEERYEIESSVNEYYNGYVIGNQNIRLYNIGSVLQYLHRRQVQSFWCSYRHSKELKVFFKNSQIQCKLKLLLLGNELQLKSQPFSHLDIIKLSSTIINGTVECLSSSLEDIFFSLLYHFGYLSISRVSVTGFVSLKIPNEEMKCVLAKLLLETNCTAYYCRWNHAGDIGSAIDLFRPILKDQRIMFEFFGEKLNIWYKNLSRVVIDVSETYIKERLFMILLTKSDHRQTVMRTLGENGPAVILLKNKCNVAICISVQQDMSNPLTANTLRKTAELAHKRVINSRCGVNVFDEFNNLCGKVIMGVGYRAGYFVGIAYSCYFKKGDNLERNKTLTTFGM